jgi:hypothetical protein
MQNFGATAVVLVLLGAQVALAQDLAKCRSNDPAVAVPACTALIDATEVSDVERAEALARRGSAHRDANRTDEALADLNRSIALNPSYFAYNARGRLWTMRRDWTQATSDLIRRSRCGLISCRLIPTAATR